MSLFSCCWRQLRCSSPFALNSISIRNFHLDTFPLRNKTTHYQTLGVPKAASQADIKRAYYDKSMKYHPDKNKGNEEKFRDITTAYEVLGNPRLRRLYDRGLISDEAPDASIHYPTESPGSGSYSGEGMTEEDLQRSKEAVRTFDQWSQKHYRHTFARQQSEKHVKQKIEHHKKFTRAHSGETGVLKFLIIMFIVSIIILPNLGLGDSDSSDSKKKR